MFLGSSLGFRLGFNHGTNHGSVAGQEDVSFRSNCQIDTLYSST